MNFFKYIDANGTQKVGSFYGDWNEVPFDKFLAWDAVLKKISAVKTEMEDAAAILMGKNKQRTFLKETLQTCKDSGGTAGAELLQDETDINKEIDFYIAKYQKLKETKLTPLEIEAMSLFTDVSPLALALMPKGETIDLDSIDLNVWMEAKDTDIEYLKILLYALVNKPLPTAVVSKFQWQSETDAEIEGMETELKKYSVFSKLFGMGKRLKQKLNAAIKGNFEVKDIWKHTTYANSQFQKQAKQIVADMQVGKWENVPALISMLLVETDAHAKVLKELQSQGTNKTTTKEYLELYAAAYKKVFDKNQVLFFGQKQKLTVAHVVGIRNFFLYSPQK